MDVSAQMRASLRDAETAPFEHYEETEDLNEYETDLARLAAQAHRKQDWAHSELYRQLFGEFISRFVSADQPESVLAPNRFKDMSDPVTGRQLLDETINTQRGNAITDAPFK